MLTNDSVTRWVVELRDGDELAAARLWDRFYPQLTRLANEKLGHRRRLKLADEDDIAQSAFRSFWQGLRAGRFPNLECRSNLWRLLIVIATRKIADQFAYERRGKRRGDRVVSMDELGPGRQAVTSGELEPDVAAEMGDRLENLLGRLGREDLQRIALLKMQGFTNPEIAEQEGRSLTTIERKLRTIRSIWRNA